jgi:hypothetical protein
MERLIGTLWLPDLASDPKFYGPNQFAYLPGRGARDALAIMVLTWLHGMWKGMKFGLYCSDVSGAFDKVDAGRLVEKLRVKGFTQPIIQILQSWLRKRTARVVGGRCSQEMGLENQVFQGTVWGPSLWNTYFEDATDAVETLGFIAMVFADDLDSFKAYPLATENHVIIDDIDSAQTNLHLWGDANSVQFDPGKESKHVVSTYDPWGNTFKILGVTFDCKLIMDQAVHETAIACGWKLQTLLRSSRFFNCTELINLYKSHVLSRIEYRTAAIYHASDSILSELDHVQNRMLKIVNVSEVEALLHFNLAPLSTRRDIAMLGLIHRAARGRGPKQFQRFFQLAADEPSTMMRTRLQARRHTAQLQEYRDGSHTEYVKRSALGLVSVYNLLPHDMLAMDSVSMFQGALQAMIKARASSGEAEWQKSLSPRWNMTHHPLLH